MSSPSRKAIGINSDANMRIGVPIYGIFPSREMLTGISRRNSVIRSKTINVPKTVFHFSLMKLIASPTEKKTSPRNCSIVTLDATVLVRKKMAAKENIPSHIAPIVNRLNSSFAKGRTGNNP